MSVKQNIAFNENEKKLKDQTENVNTNFNENFDPPDGGWGWIIVIAAGLSNFCIFSILQSFGLIFKDRFAELGINSSQTTTILNINCAVTSCIGLVNGPLFRKYSYRQIAFVGGLICAISVTVLSMTKNFTSVLIVFSILYGTGIGITMSANALALNTYFKKRKRIAVGLSWTCTGIGPIVMPQIVTLLMPIYDMEGTVLIFGGLAFNAVVCALLLQPVSLHVKRRQNTKTTSNNENVKPEELLITDKDSHKNYENTYQNKSLKNFSENTQGGGTLSFVKEKFGSQYLYYNDEEDGASGIDIIDPGTPMMSRANDGWFSRKNTSTISITSRLSRQESSLKNQSRTPSLNLSRQSSFNRGLSLRNLNRQNSETEKSRKKFSNYQPLTAPLIIVNESCGNEDFEYCKNPNCNHKFKQKLPEEVETDQLLEEEFVQETRKKTFLEALMIFFDLDLLRDLVYVNMMLGITFANFTEMNFSLLTPFILGEYGFSKNQIATVMSILAGFDVFTRLTIPFIANFIGWQNRTFYLVGICVMATGRIVLAHIQDFGVTLAIAVLIGVGKGLRTIFMALVIPTHVPLSRLPGATGIQLLTSGIVALTLGPVVGWIRDVTSNYAIMLHCLNIFTYLTVILWSSEICYVKRKSRKTEEEKQTLNKLNI